MTIRRRCSYEDEEDKEPAKCVFTHNHVSLTELDITLHTESFSSHASGYLYAHNHVSLTHLDISLLTCLTPSYLFLGACVRGEHVLVCLARDFLRVSVCVCRDATCSRALSAACLPACLFVCFLCVFWS